MPKAGSQDIRITPDGLTEFDPILNTQGNRPTRIVRADARRRPMAYGDEVRADANPRPAPEPEVPSLPRRDYTP